MPGDQDIEKVSHGFGKRHADFERSEDIHAQSRKILRVDAWRPEGCAHIWPRHALE